MTGNHVNLRGLAAGLLLCGCSIITLDPEPCESDSQCWPHFGPASICGDEGFCSLPGAEDTSCATISDCRARAGFGTVCSGAEPGREAPSGECVAPSVPARCRARAMPDDLFSAPEAHADRVVFGVLMDRSVQAHIDRENAIELAAIQINENGGLDGHPIGLVFCDIHGGAQSPYADDLLRPDAAISTAEWLVEQLGVPGLIGPPSSGDAQLLFEEVTNAEAVRGQTLIMTPSATDPSLVNFDIAGNELATDDAPGLLWRTAPSAEPQLEALIGDMQARGVTRVAIIREQSPFAGTFSSAGQSLAQSFTTRWSGDSAQFTYTGGNSSEREERVREVGRALAEEAFEAVFFIGPSKDSHAFLAQATDDHDYADDLPIYFPDMGATDELFEGIANPRLFGGVRATRPTNLAGFVLDNFVASYRARYGGVDPLRTTFTTHAYDAMWLLALGTTWAIFQGDGATTETDSGYPSIRGTDIARGLRRTAAGTVLEFRPSSWAMGMSQFRSGRPIDVYGTASHYAFDPGIEEAPGAVELVRGTEAGAYAPASE